MVIYFSLFSFVVFFIFFFSSRRRHTRYIGDWSSDVCSSDLCFASLAMTDGASDEKRGFGVSRQLQNERQAQHLVHLGGEVLVRSEERRVGKEGRSRRWRAH